MIIRKINLNLVPKPEPSRGDVVCNLRTTEPYKTEIIGNFVKMTDEFKPPISERTTTELLEIVGDFNKWNPRAVQLANNELQNRKVEQKKIETAKYLSKKRKRVEENLKANESYHICDFILEPFGTLFEIIVSWELSKDGYVRKAKQQKILRLIIGIIALIFFIAFNLINN